MMSTWWRIQEKIFHGTSGYKSIKCFIIYTCIIPIIRTQHNTWKPQCTHIEHENVYNRREREKKLSHLNTMYDWCVYNRVARAVDGRIHKDYVFKARCQCARRAVLRSSRHDNRGVLFFFPLSLTRRCFVSDRIFLPFNGARAVPTDPNAAARRFFKMVCFIIPRTAINTILNKHARQRTQRTDTPRRTEGHSTRINKCK